MSGGPAMSDAGLGAAVPAARRLPSDPTGRWLKAAWADMRAAPGVSFGYGALIVAASWLVTYVVVVQEAWFLLLPMLGGFLFVAPLLAVGLYETSRRLGRGEPVSLVAALTAFRRNPTQIALMGLALLLFLMAWARLALLMFALFFGLNPPPLADIFAAVFLTTDHLPFVILSNLTGAVLALLVFSISAVSIPLLLDRDVDVITAAIVSVKACRANWRIMAGWAALIVLLTGFGLITFYIGLAVTMPLVGHATWHAYKDLVE